MRFLVALAAFVLFPSLAFAHTDAGSTAGFLHGLEHPIGGLDHVLAMVAVGVLAAVLGGRALWAVPLSFVGAMILGFGLGALQWNLPLVELGIALSSVAIGAAAAWGRPIPVTAAMALVGVFAVFHGHAHGAEMPAAADGWGYAAGFVVATATLHAVGLAGTLMLARLVGRHGQTLARMAGGVFVLGGLGILGGWI